MLTSQISVHQQAVANPNVAAALRSSFIQEDSFSLDRPYEPCDFSFR